MSIQDYNKAKQTEQLQAFSDRMTGNDQRSRFEQAIAEEAERLHPQCPQLSSGLTIGSTLKAGRPKILVIGQAPPDQKQTLPYDTTMLYDWLEELGISKDQAQHIFDWEAVCPVFVGRYENGGHRIPPAKLMFDHWKAVLEDKVIGANKVWVLGGVARDFIETMENIHRSWSCNTEFFYSIHPSKRNLYHFRQVKDKMMPELHNFIYF